jgi:phosphoenolpyruvate carboxykinase (diphosphate)
VVTPVDAVLFGRRNNPPERKDEGGRQKAETDQVQSSSSDSSFILHPSAFAIRSLAVFNPIHYQELPELFMDFICSLTGKSPSTTGAGSEGAMTKGPFNALMPTADLNTALVSYILTGLGGFSTAAGYVGPNGRVDHDLSLMIPELWCRLRPEQRDPKFLIQNGYLEKLEDFEHGGRKIPASRLGYRITYSFVRTYFGRLFANPNRVLDPGLLKPELQDADSFADGILNIAEAQQRVARQYFADGSIAQACPPLQALLHIMAHGQYEGKTAHDECVRGMFTRDYLLASDWYAERLRTKQERDRALWQRHVAYISEFVSGETGVEDVERLHLRERLAAAKRELERVSGAEYLAALVGTVGADGMKATF